MPLRGKPGEGLGRESARQRAVEVKHAPAFLLQAQAGVHVLSDAVGRNAANLFYGCAAQHAWTAAIKSGIVPVFARLDHAEEQLLLLPSGARLPVHAMLERIEIVKILGALDARYFRISKEPQGFFNQFRRGHVVGIESDNKFSVRLP